MSDILSQGYFKVSASVSLSSSILIFPLFKHIYFHHNIQQTFDILNLRDGEGKKVCNTESLLYRKEFRGNNLRLRQGRGMKIRILDWEFVYYIDFSAINVLTDQFEKAQFIPLNPLTEGEGGGGSKKVYLSNVFYNFVFSFRFELAAQTNSSSQTPNQNIHFNNHGSMVLLHFSLFQ